MKFYSLALVLCATVILTACVASRIEDDPYKRTQDGYPLELIDVSAIEDAVPKVEPRTIAGNKSPYTVFGETYEVMASEVGYSEQGIASFYGTKFHGRLTSNGEPYDMFGMTAAHKSMPIPSYARVTNLQNQRQVVVRINDRGPFHDDRVIDLSWAAARKLGYDQAGTAPVLVEAIVAGVETEPELLFVSSNSAPEENAELSYPFLQVAALSGYDAALELSQRLANILQTPVAVHQEGTLYKVRVGPVATEANMELLRQELSDQGYSENYLVFANQCDYAADSSKESC